MYKIDIRKGDRMNKATRLAQALADLIYKHAEDDVHWTGEQSEPEINEQHVQVAAYEELIESEQLDDLFDELKEEIFDQVRYEKRQALIEEREEEKYQAAHQPKTNVG